MPDTFRWIKKPQSLNRRAASGVLGHEAGFAVTLIAAPSSDSQLLVLGQIQSDPREGNVADGCMESGGRLVSLLFALPTWPEYGGTDIGVSSRQHASDMSGFEVCMEQAF